MKKEEQANPRQCIELFHLLLLVQLGQKLDKRFYALKGGCNLRFFFHSTRYSEDIDLDLQQVEPEKVSRIMDAILSSKPFAEILRVYGLSIQKWSKPKQTETTQRWKMTLSVQNSSVLLPTKAEFSRRGMTANTRFEAVDPLIIQSYHLPPVLVNHYDSQAAAEQKLHALIFRKETQARDVFDLAHLLNLGVDPAAASRSLKGQLGKAINNILSITFPVFKSQVLSYLHPDQQSLHDSESVWNDMVLGMVEKLERQTK